MNSEDIKFSYGLTIRFDQDHEGKLAWSMEVDSDIEKTLQLDYDVLASHGIPLSALGIRVLFNMLQDGLIIQALDKANNFIWRERLIRAQQEMAEVDTAPEEKLSAVIEDGAVIH